MRPAPVGGISVPAHRRSRAHLAALAGAAAGWLSSVALAAATCSADMKAPQLPTDPGLCAGLDDAVRHPGRLPLDQYEQKLGDYLRHYCHRGAGWTPDKRVRDTGPFIGTIVDGRWVGKYLGTHNPVLVWYSREMIDWLHRNRPDGASTVADAAPLPDGAMMVKEMFPAPAAACADIDPINLRPTSGAAVMVRDAKAAHDGWFWGWFGWGKDKGAPDWWAPDWPAQAGNPYPNMGFGQYCTNCHASASDNQTFATLRNIRGERGEPLVYLSQSFFLGTPPPPSPPSGPPAPPPAGYNPDFLKQLPWPAGPAPARDTIVQLPSETYDNVWMPGGPPSPASQFVTSDQCLGCHDAGSTGLQLDMTRVDKSGKLVNESPYATWRGSPMGMAGRDPIFLAQLASETGAFHPEWSAGVQDTCFGCHGAMGERQLAIDAHARTQRCEPFLRTQIDAIPFRAPDPAAAKYAALARDGISCTVCHRMALGGAARDKVHGEPQNACVAERQALLNPGLKGFAATFTGSFLLAPADVLYGPFADPKKTPMQHALGVTPEHAAQIKGADLCGSCHVVHLPVLRGADRLGYVYEQTTFAEWAFGGFRTGTTADGPLPLGPGATPQSCQDCHMPSRGANGEPARSKIASIQELSNFPQTENALSADQIDLKTREGYAQHTLVGLNLFFVKMAQQHPDVLGLRVRDPMLARKGIDPLPTTERKIVEQAAERTAAIAIDDVRRDAGTLDVRVRVANKTGHKFPSGVGFRRAFIAFEVLDAKGTVLWSSGRTDAAGVIVGHDGRPIAGEMWWKADCSQRIEPEKRAHQPHYQVVSREDQAQIYQELVAAPPKHGAAVCGPAAQPSGELTTSFLSICAKVKDNRLLPRGFLPLHDREAIAAAFSAGPDLAEEVAATAVGDDPDYDTGGGDTLTYRVPLAALDAAPARVTATLYYQATPPYFLQDRFCTSQSQDTRRLYFLAGNLDLKDTPAKSWKLELVSATREVPAQ
jgi:hypothetical protein